MDLIEALEWLAGKRSMTNIIPQDPLETWQVRICQADAAMTEQAYLVVKAHNESLLNADKSAIVRVQELEARLAAEQDKALPAWFRIQGLCSMTAVADEIITLEQQLAAAQKQLAAAQERERTLRDALDNMVRQFACTANGKRSTGGLSALEQAFEVLGLDDPHSLDTKEICDEPGCNAPRTCGWPSSAGYRNTCGKHYKPDPQYMNPEQEGVVERQDDKPTRR